MAKALSAWIVGTVSFAVPALAAAHITASTSTGQGLAIAKAYQDISFHVGHGCQTMDTYTVRVELPPEIKALRAEPSVFGKVTIETDPNTKLPKAVIWQKDDKDVLETDTTFYKLAISLKVPDQPFTRLIFPTHQTCKRGTTVVTDAWISPTESHGEGGPKPAPAIVILPERKPGWNKFTPKVDIPDLKMFFSDAAIVWKGNSAFSANEATAAMIGSTADTTALTSIKANEDIWVKY